MTNPETQERHKVVEIHISEKYRETHNRTRQIRLVSATSEGQGGQHSNKNDFSYKQMKTEAELTHKKKDKSKRNIDAHEK